MCLIILLLYLQENEDSVRFCLLFFNLQEYTAQDIVFFIQDMSLPLSWVSGVES